MENGFRHFPTGRSTSSGGMYEKPLGARRDPPQGFGAAPPPSRALRETGNRDYPVLLPVENGFVDAKPVLSEKQFSQKTVPWWRCVRFHFETACFSLVSRRQKRTASRKAIRLSGLSIDGKRHLPHTATLKGKHLAANSSPFLQNEFSACFQLWNPRSRT